MRVRDVGLEIGAISGTWHVGQYRYIGGRAGDSGCTLSDERRVLVLVVAMVAALS